jgi:putative CocE/NonD family hydrolase
MVLTTGETVWISLSDGVRLAATVWMPEGAGPVPAVLEYLPYRRRDGTAARDESNYPYYAEAGIAGIRVDSRGQGDSEGLFDDEYSPQELADACEVIAWIAAQDWSNGAVGMMGISWGGFNALQVAALRPPALKAVISIASTADRYNDDIHYKGGGLLSANISWAATMLSYASRPPDPQVVGNGWAEIWRARLADQPVLLDTWLKHQRRDDYWKHGSICEDWGAIRCPVWVIAGWADGYRNTPATILANLEAPVKAMTGPWIHKYPHFAWPKPRADFHKLSIDWWTQWLVGEPRGVTEWPDHAAYRIEGARPARWRGEDPGCWVDASGTPGTLHLSLGPHGMLGGDMSAPATIATPQHCGVMAGEYFTTVPDAQMPGDQRRDDGLSVCWDTPVLESALDISGRPRVTANVAIDQPQGNLIARLCDVHPDGTSTLIGLGVLNLCHREGNAEPRAMVPGQVEEIAVALDQTCYRVPAGHRLRLAVSTTYWPLVQPAPAPATATLSDGALVLPVAPDAPQIDIPAPERDDFFPAYPLHEAGEDRRTVEHDLTNGRVRYVIHGDGGLTENPHHGMQSHETRHEVWEIDPDDPLASTGTLTFTALRRRGAWEARTEATIRFSCRETTYDVEAEVIAWEGETEFHRKSWAFSVPRDHM